MKVKDLITELQKLDQTLDIRVEADHGQCAIPPSWVGEEYIYEEEYMADAVADEDVDPSGYTKVVIIQAY